MRHLATACLLAFLFGGEIQATPERAVVAAGEAPALQPSAAVMADGTSLPLSAWLPQESPRAVVLGLHGFNDFSRSFEPLAQTLTARRVALFAYDQRGFGASPQRGSWAGAQSLVDDAVTVAQLLREQYPELPLYVIGESMGAAVTIVLLTRAEAPVDGGILMAPAVWARATQPWYQRLGLWLGEHLLPGAEFGREWLDLEPTDDPVYLEYWENHPLVIRGTRMQALVGITELMDAALEAAAELEGPLLILYGGEDRIVPAEAVCAMLERLPVRGESRRRFVYYPEGWHFLTRDTRAHQTKQDIAAWLESTAAPLPSGLERTAQGARDAVCDE